jgi:alpha-glucosidase
LDFSSVNTQFLSALEPMAFQYAAYFSPRTDLPILAESNKPRRDIGFDGLALKLDGKAYTKGLSLHSHSEVGYRLPGKFRRFKALVGIDDAVRPSGDLQLEIRGDQKLLFEGRIRGSEAARPLDLDITGVKRIDILVDFGADLDIADVLDLCEARVIK